MQVLQLKHMEIARSHKIVNVLKKQKLLHKKNKNIKNSISFVKICSL